MKNNPVGIILLIAVLVGAWYLVNNNGAGADGFGFGGYSDGGYSGEPRWDRGLSFGRDAPCPAW